MPLPLTGSLTASAINTEIGRSSTDFFNLNGLEERYLAASAIPGTLDIDFNAGTGANSSVLTTSIQSDGKVIIGGVFTSYSGEARNRIARLHSNGILDTGFNVGTGASTIVFTTSIGSDGKVIIGGNFTSYSGTTTNRIARLHSNGVLDTGFNVGTGAGSTVNTSSIQSDGKVIIGGAFTSYSGTTTNRIARLHSNGILDTGFNVGTGANSTVNTSSIQSDGKVIIGGIFTSYSGTTRKNIARLHSNGVLDTGFNVGTGVGGDFFTSVNTSSIQSDGKVIIGGNFISYSGTTINRVARLHSNGVLDTGFNVGTGANSSVYTTPIQSDGKVIIGGAFTSYSGTTTNRIARLHSNGILDTDFNVGTGASSTVCTTSIGSDGKVIIGGDFISYYNYPDVSGTARLHSNGVLDTGFNAGTGANSAVCTTSIQSDGKIIIGGFFTSYSGTTRNRIARLHSNGILDTGFNVGTGANSTVCTTSIQSDGKVIIGGAFTSYSGTTTNRIARLHSNGILDTGFNVGTGANSTVNTSSIQSDGKVIIGGAFTSYSGTTTNRIARLHSNGILDTGFNVGTGTNSSVCTTSIQSDGKVIIGGVFTSYSGTTRNRIARLHTNGVLDTGFNVGTGVGGDFFSTVNTSSIQSDGKVIIGGAFTSYSGTTTNRIARLHSNGILDTGFNVGTGADRSIETISIGSDGKVIIGGDFTSYSGTTRNRIARLHSNGILDTDFNVGTGADSTVITTSIQSDGKVIIGGQFTSYNYPDVSRIARINTDLYRNPAKIIPNSIINFNDYYGKVFIPVPGTLDTSFNVGTGASSDVYTTSIGSDGKVIIGGLFTSYSGTTRNRIARLHSNGVLDTDFNVGTGANGSVEATSIQSDNKVIIGGFFTSYSGTTTNRIARIHTNGSLDTEFDVGTGASNAVFTTSIQSDGKVIIGGAFTSYSGEARNRIARLHTNGVLDTGFNVGTGASSTVSTSSIQSDGKVIIGGVFFIYSGTTTSRIARLHSNGVLDTDFNVGTGANGTVITTSIQSDGKVIIGGFFTSYSGEARNRIARLHANGVLDTGFDVGTGALGNVNTTSIQSDGKVIIGGDFTSYSGTTTNRIARLHSNGVLDTGFTVGTGAISTVCTASIQSDGKVIIGGEFTSYNYPDVPRIARLHSNGVLDTGFDVGTGANSNVCTSSIQSDGKLIIVGDFTSYSGTTTNRIARLHTNGVLDTEFDVGTGANSTVRTTLIQTDGKIIIGGTFTSYSGEARNRIARLHSNGVLDTEFDVGAGASSLVFATSIQSDGKVIIGGQFTSYSGTTINRIARLHTNGVLDTGFDVGTGANSNVNTTSIQSDGKVIIGGGFTSYSGTTTNRIARLHSNGVLDTEFDVGAGASSLVFATSIQSDGKVIIGGNFTRYRGTIRNRIARLHTNGSLDTEFDVGTGASSTVFTTSIQSDGKVIIGGEFTIYSGTIRNRIARLHANGVLDTDFNFGTGASGVVLATSIQSDGKVIIGGLFTSYNYPDVPRIARINAV